jgi:hypothetical protein
VKDLGMDVNCVKDLGMESDGSMGQTNYFLEQGNK